MRIGIDIDGVLNNLEEYHRTFGTRFCFEHNLPFVFKPEEYKIRHMFQWDRVIEKIFYETYYPLFLTSSLFLRTHAKEALELLHRRNELFIVTARLEEDVPFSMKESMYELTQNWLHENGLCYDHLILGEPDKSFSIAENDLDLMIEDNPGFLLNASSVNIPSFCFDAAYNRIPLPEKVIRIHSWYEALIFLKEEL